MSNSVTTNNNAKLTSPDPTGQVWYTRESSRRSRNAPAAQGGVAVGGGYIGRGALHCQQAFIKIFYPPESAVFAGFLATPLHRFAPKSFGTAAFIFAPFKAWLSTLPQLSHLHG